MSEGRQLAEDRLREIATAPIADLVVFEDRPLDAEDDGPSGGRYRVRVHGFWDGDPYDSDFVLRVDVTGRGRRWFQRWHGIEMRGPEDEFLPHPEGELVVDSTWTEVVAFLLLALFLLAVLGAVGAAFVYLVTRLV